MLYKHLLWCFSPALSTALGATKVCMHGLTLRERFRSVYQIPVPPLAIHGNQYERPAERSIPFPIDDTLSRLLYMS
jgi:hypothetical protein